MSFAAGRQVTPAVAIASSFALAVVTGALIGTAPRTASLLVLAGVAAAASLIVRLEVLPIVALSLAFYLPVDIKGVPVAWLPVAAWLARSLFSSRRPSLFGIPTVFGVWLVASLALASTRTTGTILWTLVAVSMLAVAPVLRPAVDARRLATALVWLLVPLAAYALIEVWVFEANPLFSRFFPEATQEWSTYRAYSSFAHPLVAGTVFAVGAGVQLCRMLSTGRRPGLVDLGVLVVLTGGVLATQSRSAALATLCAWGVAVVFTRVQGLDGLFRKAGFALVVASLVGLASVALSERLASEEAQASTTARSALLTQIVDAGVRGGPTGIGPGASEEYRAARQIEQTGLESSYVGVALDLGFAGLILMVALVGVAIRRSWGHPATRPFGAGLVAFSVSVGLYSALDNNPMLLVVLGMLIAGSWAAPTPAPAVPSPRRQASS